MPETNEIGTSTPHHCYRSAKVVVLGDSGVGKSGLSLVLTGQPFTLTEITHARHIWTVDSQDVELPDRQMETREIVLWDMAGQPGYRLTHQLNLNEVAVALVVFDARSEVDPFAGVYYWARALQQVELIHGASTLGMKKFLVAARMDRGGRGISKSRIDALVRELGFDDYFETSAKEGWHIAELSGAIRAAIDWDILPCIRSIEIFQHVKDFLLWNKKNTDCSLSTMNELYSIFLEFLESEGSAVPIKGLRVGFKTAIELIESQGPLLILGNLVLLRPEYLDFYMSALINIARDDPDGLGSITEERVRAGDLLLPEDQRLRDKEHESLLLLALIEDLLRREIVLREQCDDGVYLVFPSLTSGGNPDMPDPEEKAVIYTYEGPALNIFVTMVVRLTHSYLFRQRELWKNAVTYIARARGTCGIFLRVLDEGHGELTLFFDRVASEETRFHFEEYVKAHLEHRAVPGTVQRRRIFVCPTCGTPQDDLAVKRRRQRGFTSITCGVCDTKISLLDGEERLSASPSSGVMEMVFAADMQRKHSTAASLLQGKREMQDFDVFLCYNFRDKAAVKEIGQRLKEQGILPWLDEWELRPGRPWQRLLEQQIGQIKSAAVFVGKDSVGPWQRMELEAFLREFMKRGCPVIPVLLPDAPQQPEVPSFMKDIAWVDFRMQEPNPLGQLIWGITGLRPPREYSFDTSDLSTFSLEHTQPDIAERIQLQTTAVSSFVSSPFASDAFGDISEIRAVIGDRSFRNYRRLARTIFQRMGIPGTNYTMIEAPHFAYGTAWEVTLPRLGLRLNTQRAVVLLRQTEQESICYEDLKERTRDNAFIIIMDISEVPHLPFEASYHTLWFSPDSLIEMVETSTDQLAAWLGRFILTNVEMNIKQSLLPYATEGAADDLFVGRKYERMRLTRTDRLGGIITGAHQSGKSSLLKQLAKKLQQDGLTVIGPCDLGGIGMQTFFERTLKPLGITPSSQMTPETWAEALRSYNEQRTRPIFLLDEVDDLLALDAQTNFPIGRQMRSLQSEDRCKFYLAGHDQLRKAMRLEYSPFRNFATPVNLTGVTEEASKQLIQIPMKTIGFDINDEKAHRIFMGTAGVPFLIQDFCIRLLCGLSPGQVSKPEIDDSSIKETEQESGYFDTVFHYYEYAQEWDSMCVMLITAIMGEAGRQDILHEFKERGLPLKRTRLDHLLRFLIDFGVLKAIKPNRYKIWSGYLYESIMNQDPESLLEDYLEQGRQGR